MLGQHLGALDADAVRDILQSMGLLPKVYIGVAEALTFPGQVILNAGVAEACTLAAPVAGDQAAGGDDGKILNILDASGKAHTVVTPNNKIINAKKTLTFNGTLGSNVTLQAWNGLWYIIGTMLGVAVT